MASGSGTSLAKIEANRRNAQKSTGPKSIAGKAKSKMNALKHGLVAQATVIPVGEAKENDTEFTQLLDRVMAELEPQGFIEEMLTERIAICYWRLRRAAYAEVGEIRKALDTVIGDASEDDLARFQHAKFECESKRPQPKYLAELQNTVQGIEFLVDFLDDTRLEFENTGDLRNETRNQLRNYLGYNYNPMRDDDYFSFHECDVEDEDEEYESNLVRMLDTQKERLSAKKGLLEENRNLLHEINVIRTAIPLDVNRIVRYEAAIERQLYKALDKLEDLQWRRKSASQN